MRDFWARPVFMTLGSCCIMLALSGCQSVNDALTTSLSSSFSGVTSSLNRVDQGPAEEKLLASIKDVKSAGPDHRAELLELADLYTTDYKHEQAKQCYKRLVELDEKQYGKDSTKQIDDLMKLSDAYIFDSQYDQSTQILERCLKLLGDHLGDDPDKADKIIAQITNNVRGKNNARAEELCKKALALKPVGPDNPTKSTLIGLYFAYSSLLMDMGRSKESEEMHAKGKALETD